MTNFAPFWWTQAMAQALWEALMPLAPHALSLIQPVQLADFGLPIAGMQKSSAISRQFPPLNRASSFHLPPEFKVPRKLGVRFRGPFLQKPHLGRPGSCSLPQWKYAKRNISDCQGESLHNKLIFEPVINGFFCGTGQDLEAKPEMATEF